MSDHMPYSTKPSSPFKSATEALRKVMRDGITGKFKKHPDALISRDPKK